MISSCHKKALEILAFNIVDDDFYHRVVQALALVTGHKWAIIFTYIPQQSSLKVEAFWADNKHLPSFQLPVQDTPWAEIYLNGGVKTHTYIFTQKIEKPISALLKNACICQSEFFFSDNGQPLGHIATLHDEKLIINKEDKHFFHYLSQKIGFEHQQMRINDSLILGLKMIESTNHMMSFVDKNYIYRMVSKGYEDFFGVPANEIIGCKVEELLGKETFYDGVKKELDHCLAGNIVCVKHWLTPKGKRRIFVDVNQTPCFDGEGRVLGVVVSAHDITETKLNEDRIIAFAHIDSLTDLPNRRYLFERLSEQLAKFQRHGGGAVIFFIDLDGFKEVNDTYGHASGDRVLQEIAIRLKNTVRKEDIVARIGGDEFIILITGDNDLTNDIAEGRLLAEKILSAIAKPISVSNSWVKISASIGVHCINERDLSVDDIIRKADVAMYKAKQYGRNRVYVG